jgi:hypothetical protein
LHLAGGDDGRNSMSRSKAVGFGVSAVEKQRGAQQRGEE